MFLAMVQSSPPTLVRYKVLAWACTLSMLTYIDRVCIKQVEAEISGELHLTPQQFSWVFAAFGLAYALFEVPSGWLGDRFGPRRVLCRIVIWWSVFTALTGLVWHFTFDSGYVLYLPFALGSLGSELPLVFTSLMLLVLIRFLFGAGEAGAYPNIARALRNWFPYGRRGLAQGLLWMFGRWGGAIAPVLIWLFATLCGWRGAFVAFGVLGVLWVIAFARYFRDSPQQHTGVNQAELDLIGVGGESAKPAPLSWQTMLRSPTLWCLSLMYFCSNAGWCFFITHDVKYYQTVLGMDGALLRIASGAPLFFGGIACILGGFSTDFLVPVLGKRWGRTLQGFIAYAVGGLLFLLARLGGDNPWLAVPCLCLASFVKDFAMAASWSTCIDIGDRYSGTVAGFMNMVGNLGTFFSPPIVAALADQGDWGMALTFSSAMFFMAALGWIFINPRKVIVYAQ